MTRAKTKPGYAELRRSAPETYRAIRNYLRSFDRWDWGYRYTQHGVRAWACATDIASINEWISFLMLSPEMRKAQRRYYRAPQAMSLALHESHDNGVDTLMVCSSGRGAYRGKYTLVFDIDDKAGRGGVAEVQAICNGALPAGAVYWQSSTSGTGLHGYWWFRTSMDAASLRRWAAELEASLNAAAVAYGVPATVEVRGLPPVISKSGFYETAGLKVKAPRLTLTEWPIYLSDKRPWVTVQQVLHPVDVSTILTATETANAWEVRAHARGDACSDVSTIITATKELNGPMDRAQELRGSNPVNRLNVMSLAYANRLGRAPSGDELWTEYHHLELDTGDDLDGNRRSLIDRQADWIAENWNEARACGGFIAQRDRLLAEIERRVSEPVRREAQQRHRFACGADLVALCLYCILQTIGTNNGVAQMGVLAMATKVGVEVAGAPEVKRKRVGGAMNLLVQAGIVETDHAYWFNGGSGRAKCYRYIPEPEPIM